MADNNSPSLDYWRKFFRCASGNIFQLIERAIIVASADYPTDFLARRDQIAETLYTCRAELQTTERVVEENGSNEGVHQESKVTDNNNNESTTSNEPSTSNRPEDLQRFESKYSYGEAEALTDELEEESQIVGEVMRIKGVLANWQDESEKVLFDSLRQLQLMELSVEILNAMKIERAVICVRKHNSKQIQRLAQTLIEGWRHLVNDWLNAASSFQETTPDSVFSSPAKEEDGLPFPPLDVGALLATQTTSMDLSKFFDEMDDDGNLINSGEFEKNGRKSQLKNINSVTKDDGEMRRQEVLPRPPKSQEVSTRLTKPQDIPSSLVLGRQSPQAFERKATTCRNTQQWQDPLGIPMKPSPSIPDVPKQSEEVSYKDKIEISKRKLQERYQEAANAKKQRSIQVIELKDFPKQVHSQKQSNVKHGRHIKKWMNIQPKHGNNF